jgi:AraC family transcriptional regulator
VHHRISTCIERALRFCRFAANLTGDITTVAKILPPGQHYGATLRSWSSARLTVSRIRYATGTNLDLHGNAHASVVFVEDGLCVKQMDGKLVQLAPATGLFLPPRWLQKDSFPQSTTFLSAEFSDQFLQHIQELAPSAEHALTVPPAHSQVLRTHLRSELMHPDPFSPLVLEGLLMSTVAHAGRIGSPRRRRAPLWLLRAKEILQDFVVSPPSLEEIAQLTGVHPAHLSREFRRHFGSSPGEYARRVRIERAKTELSTSNRTIAEVSVAHGFSDQAHFSRVFKRHTSLTPLEYRQSFKPGQARKSKSNL